MHGFDPLGEQGIAGIDQLLCRRHPLQHNGIADVWVHDCQFPQNRIYKRIERTLPTDVKGIDRMVFDQVDQYFIQL